MAECFDVCQGPCGRLIESTEDAHWWHDPDRCDRALNGLCDCDGWICSDCCPVVGECSPLQIACQEARDADRAGKDAWEAAQTVPASTEGAATVPAHPMSGFYFGGVG